MNTICIIIPPPILGLKRERQREINDRGTGKGKAEDIGVKKTGAQGSLCTSHPLLDWRRWRRKMKIKLYRDRAEERMRRVKMRRVKKVCRKGRGGKKGGKGADRWVGSEGEMLQIVTASIHDKMNE